MNNITFKLLLIFAFLFGWKTASAQTYHPPQAYSFDYSQYGNNAPSGTENFANYLLNTPFGIQPIYMSSIYSDDPVANPGEVIAMIIDKADPTNILYRESFLYPECTDIQMGVTQHYQSGINYVLVAYHKANVGHLLDIYEVTTSPINTLVLVSTHTLSNVPYHTTINMDSDMFTSRAVITWEHPDEGIQATVVSQNQPYGITTLAGTIGASNPDIAMNHLMPTINTWIDWVHIVYQDKAQNTIKVSTLPLGTVAQPIGTTATVINNIVDVRTVPDQVSKPHIDAPDFGSVYAWAYTYTDGKDVIVRLREASTYNTLVLNNGSVGNIAQPSYYTAHIPTLFYGSPTYGTGGITVAWRSMVSPNEGFYVAAEVTPGGTLLNASDYMYVNFQYAVNMMPGIDLARTSEAFALDYLYATCIIRDGKGGYTLLHSFHKWGNTVFNGNAKLELGKASSTAFPNPFNSYISKNITVAEDGILQANLTDVTGRIVAQYNEKVSAGDQTFQIKNLGELLPGTYYLSTYINNNRLQTEVIVKR